MNHCCEDPENRSEPVEEKPDLLVTRCKVCGCRHFELSVDPAKIGVRVE